MNSYSRLEVNLLPPEMLPGPAVRYALMVNILICLVALAYILVDAGISWQRLQSRIEARRVLEAEVSSQAHIINDFERLEGMNRRLSRYGRLIALASFDYVDMPVILARLAEIIPEGVYLDTVYNRGADAGAIRLSTVLKTSKRDPGQLLATLKAYKADSIFQDCYMPSATFREEALDELMERVGISWSVSGPKAPGSVIAEQYEFEILAALPRPLVGLNLPIRRDDTVYFTRLRMGPTADVADEEAGQPPEGVTVEEVF